MTLLSGTEAKALALDYNKYRTKVAEWLDEISADIKKAASTGRYSIVVDIPTSSTSPNITSFIQAELKKAGYGTSISTDTTDKQVKMIIKWS